MKITCQSCQSRYNVADEKVQGKIVKIRCRKCGGTIIVNGTEVAASGSSGGSSAAKAPAPKSTVTDAAGPWHVNIAENEQRTMSLGDLVQAYNEGVVTQDTFIWTEGMDDWKALKEVEAVVAALHDSAKQAASAPVGAEGPSVISGRESMLQEEVQASVRSPYAASAGAALGSTVGADRSPYTASAAIGYGSPANAEGEKAARVEPRRAAVRREGRGRDLFASRADIFGSEPSDGQGVQTSAPLGSPLGAATADDASKLTGQRNENSVLFSLAVLTKNADERAPAEVEPPKTNTEDSGLIDLRALAAKAESMRPDGAAFVPPLGMAPAFGSPLTGLGLGAPLGDAQPKSKLPLWIGGGAAAILLVVLGTVIGVQVAGNLGSTSAATAPSAVAAPSASTAAEPVASAPPPVDSAAAAAAAASSVASTPKPRPAGGGGGAYHPPNAAGAKPASATPGAGAAPATAPATGGPGTAAPKKNDCGCNGDLMCLMKCSAGH
jgi:predicted Zn finger-like uncharacterized protein